MLLYEHQQYALAKALEHDRYGLFMDFGTGKTLVALKWLLMKDVFPALVVCPKSVIPHWYRELNQYIGADPTDITCINYESLHRVSDISKFRAVVFDESTYIKNFKAVRTRRSREIAKKMKNILLLTALPAPHHYDDLFSQFQILDPEIFGNYYWKFINHYYTDITRYKTFAQIPEVWSPYDEKELKAKFYMARKSGFPMRMLKLDRREELINKISLRSIIIDKSVLGLPEKKYIKMELVPTERQRQLFSNNDGEGLTGFLADQRIASGFYPNGLAEISSAKIHALRSIRESLGDEKLLVWAHYISDILRIKAIFGKRCEFIKGSTQDRDPKLQEFLYNPEIDVLVCQQRAFGIGTNITPVRYVVYYSNSFNYEDRVQSEDRVHRIGQKDTVFIIDFIVHESDQAILNAYERGQDIQESLKYGT